MDYFGSINPQKAQALGALTPDPLASGGWGFCLQSPFRLND